MRYPLYIFIFLTVAQLSAQQGYHHLNLSGGLDLDVNQVHTLSYELNKGNFNAWDISIEALLSDFDEYRTTVLDESNRAILSTLNPAQIVNDSTILLPIKRKEEIFQATVHYKPMLLKNGNMMLHFRYGGGVGRSTRTFLLSAGAGFELSYTLPGQFAIFVRQQNQYFINIDNRFRHSLQVGFKIPF